MIKIRSASLQALSVEEKELIASCKRELKESHSGKLLTLIAEDGDRPVGIIILLYYPVIHSSLIVHFYVQPKSRNRGIGLSLLKEAQIQLKERQIRTAEIRFESADPTTPALLNILKELNWSSPQPVMTRYYFDPLRFTPYWLNHPPKLPEGQELFPWSELSSTERQQIEQWVRTNPLIEYLSPFEEEKTIASVTSVGLRDKSGVIGWVITHHPSPEILRYSVYYIHPEHRGRGNSVALLAFAIRQHATKDPKSVGLAEINLANSTPFWKKFVKNRLSPFSIDTNQLFSSHKIDF